MHSHPLIPGLAMLSALTACGASDQDQPPYAASAAELSAESITPSLRPAAFSAPLRPALSATTGQSASAPALSVSCDQPVRLPQGSTVTTTCTVTSGLAGQVDVMVRGVPPAYSATLLAETASVAAGDAVRFPVGINTSDQAGDGLVMLRIEHSGIQDVFYDAIEVTPTQPRRSVKLVYLVPSDGVVDYHAVFALDRAARHLQSWLGEQLAESSTIVLAHDEQADYGLSVASVRLPQASLWYAQHPAQGQGEQDSALLTQALAATGGAFNDPRHAWVYYADVPGAAQVQGGGGVALFGADELRALVQPGPEGACSAVGTLGAALVRSLGAEPSEHWKEYPSNALSTQEAAMLESSEVVSSIGPLAEPLDCSDLTPP